MQPEGEKKLLPNPPLKNNDPPLTGYWLCQVRRGIDEFYRPYFTTDETRYTELMIAVDNNLVRFICYFVYHSFNSRMNPVKNEDKLKKIKILHQCKNEDKT